MFSINREPRWNVSSRSHKATPGKAASCNFLLAWWNAAECGGFDLTDVWAVDTAIAVDMLRVFALVAGCQQYPDAMGYGQHFERIVRTWRPALTDRLNAGPVCGDKRSEKRYDAKYGAAAHQRRRPGQAP